MATIREIDPTQTPLDPDATQMQPPLSGTVDDDDNSDDERWDENEAPTRKLSDRSETREEFRLDEREEAVDEDAGIEDEDRVSLGPIMSEGVETVIQRLVGAWKLVEWSEVHPDGTLTYPLGEQAIGQLIYTASGHMAAQLASVERAPFRSDDWRAATRDEGARAFKEYFGYFGTYTLDRVKHAVVHHVQGAWFPNLEQVDQIRMFHFEDEQLVLDADTQWGKVKIVWARA